MRISTFPPKSRLARRPIEGRRVQRKTRTPTWNMERGELDSEDGNIAGWRCIQIRNEDKINSRHKCRWVDRRGYCWRDHRGWSINTGGSNGRRLATATSKHCVLRFLLRTAAMCAVVLGEIAEAYQRRDRRDGNQD